MNQVSDSQAFDIILPQKITLKKTFPAEFFSNTSYPIREYIYIDEIDDNAIKIITKTELPESNSFSVKLFYNEDSADFTAYLTEKEILRYGYKKYEMTYDTVTPEAGIIITCIAGSHGAKTKTKAKTIHPQKQFNIQIYNDDEGEWETYFIFITTFSNKGIEYSSQIPLPANKNFLIKFFMIDGERSVPLEARVLFEKKNSNGMSKGWLEFTYIPEKSQELLDDNLTKMVQGEVGEKQAEPICNFN